VIKIKTIIEYIWTKTNKYLILFTYMNIKICIIYVHIKSRRIYRDTLTSVLWKYIIYYLYDTKNVVLLKFSMYSIIIIQQWLIIDNKLLQNINSLFVQFCDHLLKKYNNSMKYYCILIGFKFSFSRCKIISLHLTQITHNLVPIILRDTSWSSFTVVITSLNITLTRHFQTSNNTFCIYIFIHISVYTHIT